MRLQSPKHAGKKQAQKNNEKQIVTGKKPICALPNRGRTRIEVRLQDGTVWLTQELMAELFRKDLRTINEHIQNIFEEGELIPESAIRKFRITAADS